jgi:NitT/TauT family transport system ATP-binding protein
VDVGIEVLGVSLTYRPARGAPTEALAATTCRFPAGQVTALIGPSGCGKSTLLQIIRGFLNPSAGRIAFSGGAAPRMATVWQAFNLFPWRTVLDNVAFGLEAAGMPRPEREARAMAALAQVELAGFEQKYPRQLSGGMRQRVGIARALVMDPEVILLDEPFGALDAQTRLVLQDQLTKLVETTGKTVVLVTHAIEEAILLADLVLVMTARPGRIAAEISVDLPRPRDRATLRSAAGMALFDRIHDLLRDEVLLAMRAEAG